MNVIELERKEHTAKSGKEAPRKTPNVQPDCILKENGETIGAFIRLTGKAKKLAAIADAELRSDRVPKSTMERKELLGHRPDGVGIYKVVQQYSCIIGSIPPKPHMRRVYPSKSRVHEDKKASTYIKAMYALAKECADIYQKVTPELAKAHIIAMRDVNPKWTFTDWFTSSISNCNISVNYHQDNANVKQTCNFIITKRWGAKGGNLVVPDYNACFNQEDDTLLIYPAWRNLHAVTPIEEEREGGYRNSLVFYALNAFTKV